ncbi:MAG: MerR family transcriptional regulator [Pseudomonadota bacterium]
MMLKVGELAKRAGLTVRALHHYDSIGLLSPSARSDAGYRLYDVTDIARLHQIQAMRRFGMPLSDIGSFLASAGSHLPAIVDQQIAALDQQIAQAGLLRDQLAHLRRQLAEGEQPDLADWLTTLENMTMYDKYFTKEQRDRLPFVTGATDAEWKELVSEMHALMAAGIPPEAPAAQQLSLRWMEMIERDTGGDAALLVQLNAMQQNEAAVREGNRITPELEKYHLQACGAYRLALYEKYLSPQEYAFFQAHYGERSHEWPPLIARVQQAVKAGTAPLDPVSQQLAAEWMDLFCSYAGTDPATHAKFRAAHASEPALAQGSFVKPSTIDFIKAAITAAAQRKTT